MDQFVEWLFRGVATALVGALAALFVRTRKLETEVSVYRERFSSMEAHGTKASEELAREVHKMQLCLERSFVRQDQWVPAMSRIEGMLERHGELLARLDERQKANGH